jgi:citrate synthase
MPEPVQISNGLDDVYVDRSAISLVDGERGGLAYRGYDIFELVPGVPYESVVRLLLQGAPPDRDPAPEIVEALRSRRDLSPGVARLVDTVDPKLPPLQAMLVILAGLADAPYPYPPTAEQGLTIMARLPVALARYMRRAHGLPMVEPRPEFSQAANYLYLLTGTAPTPTQVKALESYFVLLADHGMNASTFALTVVISTQSDLVSAETAALAALKGPVHGGAPSKVTDMLDAIGSADRAASWVHDALARRERLMGFGHRVYKVEDPRAILLHRIAQAMGAPRLALAEAVEREALAALRAQRPGQRLYTNVEFYSAVVLEAIGLPRELFTPTFAIARTAGWAAHAIERTADNRLIRPEVEYTGAPPGLKWPRPVDRAIPRAG